jgi:hypothetical protein
MTLPPDHQHPPTVYRILQRLLRFSRSNVPAMMARRAIGTFALQADPPPPEAINFRFVMVYPQNPFEGAVDVRRMYTSEIQPGLINARFRVQDSRGIEVQPDEDGHYLYAEDSPEFDSLNAFYYANFTLRMFERYAERSINWAFPAPRLTIDPHIGDQANAFYNEQEGVLGFHTYKTKEGNVHSTSKSSDIVSHETAHAVLDGLRDLYNESFGLGCRAFHESFGDMAAILVALHDDSLIHHIIKMTNGNLRTSSFLSEMAEQMIEDLRNGDDHVIAKSVYLRNAFNSLKAIPFDQLQYEPPDPEFMLGRQEHNYSRLFTGAVYDILIGVYEIFSARYPQLIAVYRARDTIGRLLVTAIELGPVGELDFSDMARAFLTSDALLYNGRYRTILQTVFAERGILPNEASDAHLQALGLLPALTLPKALSNSQSAMLFLEQEILPALKLEIAPESLLPMQSYRNVRGHLFLSYFEPRQITLQGPQFETYDGLTIDLFGGLTLTFDGQDRLRSVVYRPVTDEDIREIQFMVADMVATNRLTSQLHPVDAVPQPNPRGLVIPEADGADRLVKYPVIFDSLREQMQGFRQFLTRWNTADQAPTPLDDNNEQ